MSIGVQQTQSVFFVALALTFAPLLRCHGSQLDLPLLRTRAHFHVQLIHQIEYTFQVSDDKGWQAKGRFVAEGTRFRVERQDITGMMGPKGRSTPLTTISAYDGERFQQFVDKGSRLRLQDGNHEAKYLFRIPHTEVYIWLRPPEFPTLRWDHILDRHIWEERFHDGTYIEMVTEGGRELHVVHFPQGQAQSAATQRVYFDPRNGYLPVKYERRISATGALSTVIEVRRSLPFDVEGGRIFIPVDVRLHENGADGKSLPWNITYTVDESSIRVNSPIDQALYTLDASSAANVSDVDEQARFLGKSEEASFRRPPVTTGKTHRLWFMMAGIGILGFVCVLVVHFLRREM